MAHGIAVEVGAVEQRGCGGGISHESSSRSCRPRLVRLHYNPVTCGSVRLSRRTTQVRRRIALGQDDEVSKIVMVTGKREGLPGAAAISHGSLSYPSPMPFKLSGNPMPSSGVSKMIKVAVFAVRNWLRSLSSITTSATQPLGRHLTKPARPTS